ncbi:disks large-associated protein 5-like isoform X2 [Mizuhopecten yessoensis]|uniref:disks large-associated protein 5-like isoform X2 n=1 Tax=Mizuhopecten yessoensis TaxID=6573 RepID=UPI000B45E806|nr:disks large-associated protein 5-like isoform X2 [Mizuhopecten yessoensis]
MELQMKDAYKIKSTSVDPKKLRLHRRSIDWKQNRHEEANKGRNIQNLSPLQELSSNSSNITITSSYEGKTPVKRDAIEDNGKKRKLRTADDVKRELVKWKKEKELKKKMEKQKQLQKPSFKISHMAHNDVKLYTKGAKKGNQICPIAGFVSTQAKTKPLKPGVIESHPPARKPVVKTATKKTEAPKPAPSKFVAPAPVSGRVTRSQSASKGTKSVPMPSKSKGPSTRATRNAEKQKPAVTSKQSTLKKTVNEKKVPSKQKPQNLDLEKVSTFRGISFAPEDFTFSAPSNVSTFEFKPLSPASTAKFLCPATTSFLDTDPKRCSTPKQHLSPDFQLDAADCSVNLVDISKVSDRLAQSTVTPEATDSNCVGEKPESTATPPKTVTNEQNTPMEVNTSLSEKRRVTRGLQRSILGSQSATQSTEVNEQSSSRDSTKTPGENMMESTSINAGAQDETNDVISAAPKQLTLLKESPAPLNSKKEEKSIPKRMTRSLRRSLCLSPPSAALASPKKVATPRNAHGRTRRSVIAPSDEVATAKPLEDEVFSNSPKKADAKQTPERKVTRRTMSNLAPFLPPSSDCLVLSASRSKRKRRKTQHDRPVNPKSPEEWLNLLRDSPMIEMNRRTPKANTLEPLLKLDLDMDFDDVLSQTSQQTVNDASTSFVTSGPADDVSMSLMTSETSIDSAPSTTTDLKKDQTLVSSEKIQSDTVSSEQLSASQPQEKSAEPEEHNVKYFRKLMSTETDIFDGYCSKWEDINKNTPSLNEEVEGQIRSCIGQAQLLIRQRFKQFTGLVDNCEFGTGEKETTFTDLQGFWDMIFYQVEDVHTKFANLDKLKANNWVEDKPTVQKKVVKKKVSAKPAVKRPPVASKFAAFRSQMKKKQTVPDIICHEDPVVTFDGGFFKVSSPKRTPKFHCEAGSPQRKASTSSTEKEKTLQPKSTPLSEVLSPAVDSLGLTSLRTPSRKSYVPVNPSPLLRDITPHVTAKARLARHSFSKKLCSGVDTEPEVQSTENETDDVFSSDISEKTVGIPSDKNISTTIGTPRAKITPRRSLRSRRSLCDVSSPSSTVKDTDSNSDFFKYLQPSSTSLSKATGNSSALDNDGEAWDLSSALSAAETTEHVNDSPAMPKRRTSSLKQLPSSQRRRSTRRSVHFSASPTVEHTQEVGDIMDVSVPDQDRVGDDMLIFTPPGQKSSLQLGDDNTSYISQNAGATPAFRNSRPSLLFTPPQDTSTVTNTTTHTEIPTDILISFTP